MTGPYDDMLNFPHPVSEKHPRMPILSRAAQFSPFAALTGYEAAVQETARLTDRKIELSEDEKVVLDGKLQMLAKQTSTDPTVAITYFQADGKKEGGTYRMITGTVKKIDGYERTILLTDGQKIPIFDILEIQLDEERA